jgi:hypothetical protein
MVRRGSTVRVRQRALQIPAHGDFPFSSQHGVHLNTRGWDELANAVQEFLAANASYALLCGARLRRWSKARTRARLPQTAESHQRRSGRAATKILRQPRPSQTATGGPVSSTSTVARAKCCAIAALGSAPGKRTGRPPRQPSSRSGPERASSTTRRAVALSCRSPLAALRNRLCTSSRTRRRPVSPAASTR